MHADEPRASPTRRRCAENLPKLETDKPKPAKSSIFKPMLNRIASGANRAVFASTTPSSKIEGRPKKQHVSREQQYWYAMEISPPTDTKKGGGVTLGADGKFEVSGEMPEEMRKMLEEIQKAKAKAGDGPSVPGAGGAKDHVRLASVHMAPGAPPPPMGGAPPPQRALNLLTLERGPNPENWARPQGPAPEKGARRHPAT